MKRIVALIIAFSLITSLIAYAASPSPRLVVHEWGTFTVRQDKDGRPVPGLPEDPQPLPNFVHAALRPSENVFSKGVPLTARKEDLLVRLETPVLYFHLPPGVDSMTVTVKESFRSGWLTQFYPAATADTPGIDRKPPVITDGALGSLTWTDLKLTRKPLSAPKPTAAPVWLAPRAVDAAFVTNTFGQTEHFLFDRGVAKLESPLKIVRAGSTLELRSNLTADVPAGDHRVPALWLLDVRPDHTRAFRRLDPVALAHNNANPLTTTPATFPDSAYSADLTPLADDLHTALTAQGLNPDEATGLLNTWRAAYFDTPGTRVLYLLPRPWTDHVLPLDVSVPADITRVLIGRIDLAH